MHENSPQLSDISRRSSSMMTLLDNAMTSPALKDKVPEAVERAKKMMEELRRDAKDPRDLTTLERLQMQITNAERMTKPRDVVAAEIAADSVAKETAFDNFLKRHAGSTYASYKARLENALKPPDQLAA